jgi:hypothetical protein
MAKLLHSPRFALLFVLGLLAGACTSDDERSLVLLDITLGYGVTVPQNVVLSATQGGSEVKSATVPWGTVGNGPLKVGFFIPDGITGQVSIAGKAYTDNLLVAEGKLASEVTVAAGKTVGPVQLILEVPTVTPPVNDGGIDAETTDTAPTGGDAGDTAPPPPLDGGGEAGVADGPRDTMVVDGGQPDVPTAGDDARDAPAPTDVADATLGPIDTTLAPIDTTPAVEVGHTPTWEPAQNVENDLLSSSYAPAVAVDPINEHVYVAWEESTTIKVKRWNRLSGSWEKTITVDNRGSPNAPAIGADTKGNVMVLWGQNSNGATPSTDGVWVSQTADGSSWSPATRITTDPSFGVTLAVARNGTAHAVYSKQGGAGGGWPLYTAYYDGVGWTENPTTLDANASYTDSNPRLALNGTGDGLLIFRKDWGVVATVLTARTYTAPLVMDSDETASVYEAAVAMNRKGEGMVIWSVGTGSGEALLARTYAPSVGWSSPSPPILTSDIVASLGLALDEQGMATIVWQQTTVAGGVNMMGIHGSLAGSWSDVAALETDNKAGWYTDHYGFPEVAIDGAGNVLVAWRKDLSTSDTTTYGAYATRFAGGTWLPQAQLGLKSGLNVPYVRVAVADSGFGAAAFNYISEDATSDTDAYNVHVAFFR